MRSFYLLISLFMVVTTTSFANEEEKFTYRVIAVNAADSSVVSVSNEVNLYLPLKVYFPTAFSPNGDGLNDEFGIVGEGIDNYLLKIYNRWGELIFYSTDPTRKWNGTYKGTIVPIGTYVYEMEARGNDDSFTSRNGHVTVVH